MNLPQLLDITKDVIWKYQVLVFIVILGFVIPLWGINSSPEGLSIDEVSIGYNAWSIITTGKDEHGSFLPLFSRPLVSINFRFISMQLP